MQRQLYRRPAAASASETLCRSGQMERLHLTSRSGTTPASTPRAHHLELLSCRSPAASAAALPSAAPTWPTPSAEPLHASKPHPPAAQTRLSPCRAAAAERQPSQPPLG